MLFIFIVNYAKIETTYSKGVICIQSFTKKFLSTIVLTVFLALPLSSPALAYTEKNIDLYIDAQKYNFIEDPIIIDENIMVPLETFFTVFGPDNLQYFENGQNIEISFSNNKITFTLNSAEAIVNTNKVQLDVPVQVINNSTYAPLSFINAVLGYDLCTAENQGKFIISLLKNNELELVNCSFTETETITQTGIASWYGLKLHGRKTASGERFNAYALTAAHRELPFGTYVRVTNPKNNKNVIVKINDRGPQSPERIIDLSREAAIAIGLKSAGVGEVTLEVLEDYKPDTI